MTVSSIIPVNNYTGNSYTTTFDFDFLIEAEKELIVTHIDSNGISRILKEGVDYSINEIGNKNGSYITFPLSGSTYSVLGTDEKISLSLTLDIKQESEFRNSSYFNFDILEWTFDYIVRILQILNRKIDRSVKVSEGSETTPDALISELNNAKETAVLSAQSAESAKQTCSSYLTQTQQNIAYFENLVDSFSDTYEECLQDILDEGIETRADIDLSNLSSEGEKRFLNKTQVTNCILEEPDNTIYEYNDSSFTFKAGSIAIFPYGTSAPDKAIGDDLFNNGHWIITDIQYDSGKLFYWARKQNDLTLTSWSASAQSGDFMTCYGQDNGIYSSANNYSGTSIPEGTVYGIFYNRNDNRVYRINNGSIEEYQSNYYSFPFMILHFDNSLVPKRVKQVFKGQGYIGGTRWLDKGVKLLFPNGRNSDGTLNNIEAVSKLLILSNLNNSGGYTTIYESYPLFSYNSSSQNIVSAGYISIDRYFETDNLDEIPQTGDNAIVYRPSFNDFWWYNASEDKWYEKIYCITGKMSYNYSSASKILEFKPRNTFRAVDYFDISEKLQKTNNAPKVQSYGIIQYGSPTLSNNILSNFSQTNYVRTNTLFYPDTTTWEMNFLITTGSDVSSTQNFCSSDYNILEIGISNDKHFVIEINGGSWVKGTYTVLANTTYYVKVKYTGTQYILSYSLNGSTYTPDITYNMATPLDLAGKDPFIYYGKDYNNNNEIFSGTINLTGCNIIVDDYLIWQGVRDYNNTEYPTENRPAVVVQAFVNGTSGYRVWSDRYCEQWGYAESVNKSAIITLPLAMSNGNYNIICTGTEAQGGGDNGSMNAYNVSATGFNIYNTSDVVSNAYWRVFGYRK